MSLEGEEELLKQRHGTAKLCELFSPPAWICCVRELRRNSCREEFGVVVVSGGFVICRNECLTVLSSEVHLWFRFPTHDTPSLFLLHAHTVSSQAGLHVCTDALALSQTHLLILRLVFLELALPQHSK